jgi:hypothetical protein
MSWPAPRARVVAALEGSLRQGNLSDDAVVVLLYAVVGCTLFKKKSTTPQQAVGCVGVSLDFIPQQAVGHEPPRNSQEAAFT